MHVLYVSFLTDLLFNVYEYMYKRYTGVHTVVISHR